MVQIVGHRGAAKLVPENTVPSFERAIALGCDATECDVHLTADGHLVVCHDDRVDRTTNGTGRIVEMTLLQVRALDAGEGWPVPTLDEVLETIAGRITLLCELKADGTPAAAVATVRKAGLTEQVVFSSFALDRLEQVRAMGDELRVTGIFSRPEPEALPRLQGMRAENADICWSNLTREAVAQVHEHGLLCRGWNPDTIEDIRTTLAYGVDSVSSNRPDLVVEVVRG